MNRKGIILAGGTGSRLYPGTVSVSKQLLVVYDKPMVFYPLSILMMSGLREVAIISTPDDLPYYEKLLGDGRKLGMFFTYIPQPAPAGIAQAFMLAENFIEGSPVTLILGDNIFHGAGLVPQLKAAASENNGATIFSYPVNDPGRYGVIEVDENGKPVSIIEKPDAPKSRKAVTGLYYYDNQVIDLSKKLTPSARGELEISDVNRMYLERNQLTVQPLGRGTAWLDTGTYDSLNDAANYIATIERRQGNKIACIEEVAWRNNWITTDDVINLAKEMPDCGYRDYLLEFPGS